MLNYKIVQPEPKLQTVTSVINTIPHFNPLTGWGIFKVKPPKPTRGDTLTILGIAPNAGIGKRITATGIITTHPEHGPQLKADTITVENPNDKAGMIHMLAKAKIKGVGESAAVKIVEHYGVDALTKLDGAGLKTAGLKPTQITAVLEYVGVHAGREELITLLGKAGIGPKTRAAIIEHSDYDNVVKNPFSLLEIPRLSFTDVDNIWGVVNGDNNAVIRIKAGIDTAINRNMQKGHSGMVIDDLVKNASDLLKIPPKLVRGVVTDNIQTGELVEFPLGSGCIYTQHIFKMEGTIATKLESLHNSVKPVKTCVPDSSLSDEQNQGIKNIMDFGVSIITGGPGTGKTTLVRVLCEIATPNNLVVELAAPTGLAANRLRTSTQRKAHTIHKLLGTTWKKPVLLIVDESSMVDTVLFGGVVNKLPNGSRLVLIGDANQLPSIQHGNILNDLIESKRFPVTWLTKSFRFDSRINQLADSVISGSRVAIGGDISADTAFIECVGDECINKTVINLISRFPNAQVLTPIRGGLAGVDTLNPALAELLNPGVNRVVFGIGDKVINTKNDYDLNLANGDIGRVIAITNTTVTVEYEDGRITKALDDLNISLAYALTVHKSQGQEYETVIIALSKRSPIMLQRRLLYTAITRAKTKVIIVGTRGALDLAVSSTFEDRRVTGLKDHLSIS